jgi:sulfite oxidase
VPMIDLIEAKRSCSGLVHLDTTATIECAGNRREELGETEAAEGIQWKAGVIANVYWSGPSIRSLLLLQGLSDPYAHHDDFTSLTPSDDCIAEDCAPWAQSLHLHLLSAQPTKVSKPDDPKAEEYFGASIPLSTAMHPNQKCILAIRHNGTTLEQAHGFPIRSVIPGHAGARWVKWLRGLRISKSENDSYDMTMDYKILSPPKQNAQEWKEKMMGEGKDQEFRNEQLSKEPAMQRLGMGSAIDYPHNNDTIEGNKVNVRGYAVGQDGEYTMTIS